ncbi:MAG: hypothetical protein ABIY52_03340 [Gemmatimonadaceae bacterium]
MASLCAAATPLAGQAPRPWLDWKTVETEHFVFHYPDRYRAWTLALAERMEGIRAQVGAVVGFLPDRRVSIIVDDPLNESNGTAYTALDAPAIVLWPTPPDPRTDIGNYRVWNELVATHEFAHVAHLNRASRNHWQNLLWALSPVPLGPIATSAPRWALEGYATYVEGRVTGSGRPNHAWRAAVLRQFALEGRMPSYAAMSASTSSWESGSFAYLAGSAYFEWLARREGDSSVTALWRRMTAKSVRSFDDAFAGVYGGGPAQLYGRFVAELTADALTFERALDRDALVAGTMVQHLSRATGDPAISPDGRFIAIAIRHTDAPSEVVVWKTESEPDTLADLRSVAQLRDPDDVADRTFYPPAKRVVISRMAPDGAPYESPRWLADNRHILLTRRMPLGDGTLLSDLFLWSAEDGELTRMTKGAGIRDVDPSADGRWAAAVRCMSGWCDLVRVDLYSGVVSLLVPGNTTRNYYRPRVSKQTGEIVVAEQAGDRWRIVRVDPNTGELRYADPDDGVTRYGATFAADGRTIVTTSEQDGIPNIERLALDGSSAARLTAVTGAAVGADVALDGSLWFLSLHAGGYDLRRLVPDSASIARADRLDIATRIPLGDSLSPVLPPRQGLAAMDSSRRPRVTPVGPEHDYGVGPDVLRYIPAASTGFGGSNVQLALMRSDPVGRLGAVLLGVAGAGALPQGASLQVSSRRSRSEVVANGWMSHEAPSRAYHRAFYQGLDLARFGGALRVRREHVVNGGEFVNTLGVLAERQLPSALTAATRASAFTALHVNQRQRDMDVRYQETLDFLGEVGQTEGGAYLRQRASVFFGVAGNRTAFTTLRFSYGTVGGSAGANRELFAIGGIASPLLEPELDARRVDAPAYPLGSASGLSFASYRVAVPIAGFEVFYSGASPDHFRTARRSYGVEMRQHVPSLSPLGTPEVSLLAGFARAVDEPVKKEWRYYVSVAISP